MSFLRDQDFTSKFFRPAQQNKGMAPYSGSGFGGTKRWRMESIPGSGVGGATGFPTPATPGFAPMPNNNPGGMGSGGATFGSGSSTPGLSGLEGGGSSPAMSPASGQSGGFGVSGSGMTQPGQHSPFAFDDGGAMPDDSGSNDLVSMALATIDGAIQYGRKKFGLGGDDQQPEAAPGGGYPDFRKSGDVEDRRGESQLGNALMSPVMKTYGNAYSMYDRGKNAIGMGDNGDDQRDNPMSQAAGINDIEHSKGLQGLGDDGTQDEEAQS